MPKIVATSVKTEIQNRRRQVAEMYLRGMYQTEIAVKLGVNQATISRDLAELRKEWLDQSINHINQKKAIELAKLDKLEVSYWEAWERSLKDAETHIEYSGPKGMSVTDKSIGQSGNPAYLDGVLKCIKQRCDILGIEAPKRMDMTSDGQKLNSGSEELARSMATLADALRDFLPGESGDGEGALDAPE